MKLTKIIILFILSHCLAHANDSILLIQQLAQEVKKNGAKPVVVFDIDDTLFLTSSRSLKIVKEFINQETISTQFPEECKILKKIKESDFLYNFKDSLIKMNITNEDFIIQLSSFWKTSFFQNKYIANDKMISGASDYLNCLNKKHDIEIVYLTGRPLMNKKGTLDSLVKNNFPLDKTRTRLILKDGKYKNTIEYKKQIMLQISQTSTIIASFENESKNLEMMNNNFIDAVMIFLDIKQSAIAKAFTPDLIIKDYEVAKEICLKN